MVRAAVGHRSRETERKNRDGAGERRSGGKTISGLVIADYGEFGGTLRSGFRAPGARPRGLMSIDRYGNRFAVPVRRWAWTLR